MINSELGKIPKGWGVKPLREVVLYYIGGGWGKEKATQEFDVPAFVVRGTDIPQVEQGNIGSVPFRYHKESNFQSRQLNSLDIVFEVSGGSKGQPVGRLTLINESLLNRFGNNVICASFCKLIRCNNVFFNPYLAYWYMKSLYETEDIYRYQEQSTGISNFKFEYFLDDFRVLVPTTNVNKFSRDTFQNIHNTVTLNGEENQKLADTRDLLLPRLIGGRLRVS